MQETKDLNRARLAVQFPRTGAGMGVVLGWHRIAGVDLALVLCAITIGYWLVPLWPSFYAGRIVPINPPHPCRDSGRLIPSTSQT